MDAECRRRWGERAAHHERLAAGPPGWGAELSGVMAADIRAVLAAVDAAERERDHWQARTRDGFYETARRGYDMERANIEADAKLAAWGRAFREGTGDGL